MEDLRGQFNKIEKDYSSFVDIDPIRNFLHYPAVVRELGNTEGRRILDVGCGDGLFDRKLAGLEAKVTGYDIAPDLIAIARQKEIEEPLGIVYVVADPKNFASTELFDDSVSIMVLPYASSAEYLDLFFNSTHRFLKPKGRFISVVFNPEFRAFDEVIANRRFSRIDGLRTSVQFLDAQSGVIKFTAELSHFSKDIYEKTALKSGFKNLAWKLPVPTDEGVLSLGSDFWKKLKASRPYSVFVAEK